jgi:hypothetical protein
VFAFTVPIGQLMGERLPKIGYGPNEVGRGAGSVAVLVPPVGVWESSDTRFTSTSGERCAEVLACSDTGLPVLTHPTQEEKGEGNGWRELSTRRFGTR